MHSLLFDDNGKEDIYLQGQNLALEDPQAVYFMEACWSCYNVWCLWEAGLKN